MNVLKTMAIIYEAKNESLCHKAMKSLMLDIHYFTLVPIEVGQEGSYSLWKDSELAKNLQLKLMAAQDFYVINPKGSIMSYIGDILSYAELHKKGVHYMFKYCYPDCQHLKGIKTCQNASPILFIPNHHKLLPACESYSRVYDRAIGRPEPPPPGALVDGSENVVILGDSIDQKKLPEESSAASGS